MPSNNQITLNAILHLEHEGPLDTNYGICRNMLLFADELGYTVPEGSLLNVIASLYHKWPKFSGDYLYPVPSDFVPPNVAYCACYNLWNDEMYTQYVADRWDLLRFLIKELEKLN